MKLDDSRRSKPNPKHKNLVTAVVANSAGEIFDLEGYAAVGMAGPLLMPLTLDQTIKMPFGGELMLLPDRRPLLFNLSSGRLETLSEHPDAPGEPVFAVAAFNSPGYVIAYVSAYQEQKGAKHLPLFSYGAVGWHKGGFRTAVIQVDKERRQDLRRMRTEDILAGIQRIKRKLPDNRLRRHLETCALKYGCPAAKNFFLGRYEAPLPTSAKCNATCLGCLSFQKHKEIPVSQDRIAFKPSAAEISEIALEHIQRVKKGVVSFGQGCEGDPLLAADVIEPAIRKIRSQTIQGTVNMNTNGSKPDILERLFAAGLDSVRISLNSVRKACYHQYFRPRGYDFSDVMKSIELAVGQKKFVAVNYLNCPGFTDTPEEVEALIDFIGHYRINMIQWRNLNFDPLKYWNAMNAAAKPTQPRGMHHVMQQVQKFFPDLKHGYFNPPKEKFYKIEKLGLKP